MIIYVDIDETICRSPEDRDYTKAVPITDHIHKINELYDAGNTIVYWTARGRSEERRVGKEGRSRRSPEH